MIKEPEIMASYQTILKLCFYKVSVGIMFNLWINLLIHLLRKHFCLCFLFKNQVRKIWHIYTIRCYSAIKKTKIMPFAATRMQSESTTLSEVKSERERQIPYAITYMGNLKYDTNKPIIKQKHTRRCRERICGCRGGGFGEGWTRSWG